MEEMSNVKGLIPFVGGDAFLVRCERTSVVRSLTTSQKSGHAHAE
jgi:hypothetical protein